MRNLTLRQMRVFAAVARNLSFTRAARELHLTQPAVSQQVKLLEEEVGLPLFEQIGRKVHLAPAGVELLRYTEQALELLLAWHGASGKQFQNRIMAGKLAHG